MRLGLIGKSYRRRSQQGLGAIPIEGCARPARLQRLLERRHEAELVRHGGCARRRRGADGESDLFVLRAKLVKASDVDVHLALKMDSGRAAQWVELSLQVSER